MEEKKENPIPSRLLLTSPINICRFFARKILQIHYCVWADKRGASNGKRWALPTKEAKIASIFIRDGLKILFFHYLFSSQELLRKKEEACNDCRCIIITMVLLFISYFFILFILSPLWGMLKGVFALLHLSRGGHCFLPAAKQSMTSSSSSSPPPPPMCVDKQGNPLSLMSFHTTPILGHVYYMYR